MTDNEIIKALECCTTKGKSCKDCPAFAGVDRSDCKKFFLGALDLIPRQKAEIERLQSMNQAKLDTIHDLQVKMEAMQMDKEQLESDIINARLNLEQMRKLYEERANLCEEQDRQLLELDFILANYPYMVHFGNGTMCTENHKEYERLLASISVNAVNEVLEELKNTLVINNEGNTEFFDFVYTLETIEGLKNRGVIFNV